MGFILGGRTLRSSLGEQRVQSLLLINQTHSQSGKREQCEKRGCCQDPFWDLDVEGLSGKRQTWAVSWHLSLQIVLLTWACLTISNLGVEKQKGPKLMPSSPFTRKSEGLDLGGSRLWKVQGVCGGSLLLIVEWTCPRC